MKLADEFRLHAQRLARGVEAPSWTRPGQAPTGLDKIAAQVALDAGDRFERLADGSARTGPDMSSLGVRGVRGLFYQALDTGMPSWPQMVGLKVDTDAVSETHAFLGHTPSVREVRGGRVMAPMIPYSQAIRTRDFDASVIVSWHDFVRDKTGHIARRLTELAVASIDHWATLGIEVLQATAACYSGDALFSTTHNVGEGGTVDNALVAATLTPLQVADSNAPTREEAVAILFALVAEMQTWENDAGRPANQSARDFALVVPSRMAPGFISAVGSLTVAGGGSNPLAALGYNFAVVPEPRLNSAATLGYLFRVDAGATRAVILQEDARLMKLDVLGEDSEFRKTTNQIAYMLNLSRGAGPGEFLSTLSFTLS
jgi:hypothetical protein